MECMRLTHTCVAAHGPQRTEGLAGQLLCVVILAALALLGGGRGAWHGRRARRKDGGKRGGQAEGNAYA